MTSLTIDWLITKKTKWVYELIYFLGEFDLTHYKVGELSLSLNSFGLNGLRVWFNSFLIWFFQTLTNTKFSI